MRGSYIDFDPVRRIYAFANDDRVTILDANLAEIGETAAIFDRASGVGFAPDGRLFATDQFQYSVFQLLTIGGSGPVRLFSADGQLLDSGGAGGGDSIAFLVPEPGSLMLMLIGVFSALLLRGLSLFGRRDRCTVRDNRWHPCRWGGHLFSADNPDRTR